MIIPLLPKFLNTHIYNAYTQMVSRDTQRGFQHTHTHRGYSQLRRALPAHFPPLPSSTLANPPPISTFNPPRRRLSSMLQPHPPPSTRCRQSPPLPTILQQTKPLSSLSLFPFLSISHRLNNNTTSFSLFHYSTPCTLIKYTTPISQYVIDFIIGMQTFRSNMLVRYSVS